MQRGLCSTVLLSSLLALGCTRVPEPGDHEVSAFIKSRVGSDVRWNQTSYKDEQVELSIKQLLEKDLTCDSAVQIALLNSPKVQIIFEQIGIAQADLVQAGLFKNPIFEGYVRFPEQSSFSVNSQFSVLQNFLDLFLIPLRKKVAAVEFEKAKLETTTLLLNLTFDVQHAFYLLAAEHKKCSLLKAEGEVLLAQRDLARAQKKQGNINSLELQKRVKECFELSVELQKSQIERIRLHEALNALLGFQSNMSWKINTELPEHVEKLLTTPFTIAALESVGLAQRLDLEIMRLEIERIKRLGVTKSWWSYTNLAGGISLEKDTDGARVIGPVLSAEIPILNYGQAERARLVAMYRQSVEELKEKEVQVLSEVRQAFKQLAMTRNLILTYRKKILPLQKEIVSMSQRYYNVMALSVYKLLDAKKEELDMQLHYSQAVYHYVLSSIQLDRAIGGKLSLADTWMKSEEKKVMEHDS